MKLSTRRSIRAWLLNRPEGTLFWTTVGSIGVGLLGIVTGADAVFLGGFLAGLGAIYIDSEIPHDACPNCRAAVDVFDERYCPTCGLRLDDVEAAPEIDERVPERFRPLGLEQVERSPPVDAIADGGSYEEEDA